MTAWYLLAVANARNDKPLFKTFCCRSVEADQLRALQMKPIYILHFMQMLYHSTCNICVVVFCLCVRVKRHR